jgi:hypothetical protein
MHQKRRSSACHVDLTTFMSVAREHELAALKAHSYLLGLLERLNGTFNALPDEPIAGPTLPPLLLSQAHSAFLAAVRLSLGGHVHVAYMALRACIESGLFALIMKFDGSAQDAWVNRRHDRARCRKIFTASAGIRLLQTLDPPLKQVIQEAYDSTIDRGAHPNVLSLGNHLDLDEYDLENKVTNVLLLPADDQGVKSALCSCVEVGAAVASLCAHVMPDHYPALASHEEAMAVMKVYLGAQGDERGKT